MSDKQDINDFENEGGTSAVVDPAPESAEVKAELITLQEKLAEAEAKAAEHLDGWQRAQAEFANYKKRLAREQEQQTAEGRGGVIMRYLEIVDDLERALKNAPKDGAGGD